MPQLRYHLVDVFTTEPFGGNQLAVFMDGRGVSGELMQRIAREMNLSETTFILPPDDPANNFKVRIFTPGRELPMAGHPTVGTTFVLGHQKLIDVSGATGSIILEEGVGPINVTYTVENGLPGLVKMQQRLPVFGAIYEDRAAAAAMLSLTADDLDSTPIQVVSCGVPFLFVPVRSLRAVQNIRFRIDLYERVREETGTGEIFVFTRETLHPDSTVHSRMFAPGLGIGEDPATGAASGPLGCYLVEYGLADGRHMVSEQGFEMGRPSIIEIEIERDGGEYKRVVIGGRSVYMGEGTLHIR